MSTAGPIRAALGSRWLPWLIATLATGVAVVLLVGRYGPQIGKPNEMEAAMNQVRASLKDPESARFSDLWAGTEGKYVCGAVNAKNSMGGYVGKRGFLLQVATGIVQFEPDEASATASTQDALEAVTKRIKFLEDVQRLCGEPAAQK